MEALAPESSRKPLATSPPPPPVTVSISPSKLWDTLPLEIEITILKLAIEDENSRLKFNILGFKSIKGPPHGLRDDFKTYKPYVTVIAKLDAHRPSKLLQISCLARELYLKTQEVVFEDPRLGWKIYQTPGVDQLMLRTPLKLTQVPAGPFHNVTHLSLHSADIAYFDGHIDFPNIMLTFPNLGWITIFNVDHRGTAELLEDHMHAPVDLIVAVWKRKFRRGPEPGLRKSDFVRQQVHSWIGTELRVAKYCLICRSALLRPPRTASSVHPNVDVMLLEKLTSISSSG